MDTSRIDAALEAVKAKVERDKAQAAMDAARAREAQQAQERKEAIYRLALDDLRREILGKPPLPRPATPEQYQQFLLHRERGAI